MKCKIKLLTDYRSYKTGEEIESIDITKCKELVSIDRAVWIEEPHEEKPVKRRIQLKRKTKVMKPKRRKRGYLTK